jgi:hypothetical protein
VKYVVVSQTNDLWFAPQPFTMMRRC